MTKHTRDSCQMSEGLISLVEFEDETGYDDGLVLEVASYRDGFTSTPYDNMTEARAAFEGAVNNLARFI